MTDVQTKEVSENILKLLLKEVYENWKTIIFIDKA